MLPRWYLILPHRFWDWKYWMHLHELSAGDRRRQEVDVRSRDSEELKSGRLKRLKAHDGSAAFLDTNPTAD